MRSLPPSITGNFSVSDLVREAAERAIGISQIDLSTPLPHIPSMSGTILAEEVQPGLLLSGFDITYTADGRLEADVERSVACVAFLKGENEALHVKGHKPITMRAGHIGIVGYGERCHCSRDWWKGQTNRAFGVTLQPHFFGRFGTFFDGDGLELLEQFITPGVHSAALPVTHKLIEIADRTLAEPYGGALRALHRESQALRFTIEIAAMLQDDERLVRQLGRGHYDRVVQARQILDGNLVDPPKILDLARRLGVSVMTLQTNFKAAFGTTVFGYVRERRLEMGRHLITQCGLGIAEAGYRVGFTNAAAFSASYRRYFGRPPTADRSAPV